MKGTPPISVIICTRDRGASLASALESIARGLPVPGRLEVVVADNGSSDDTAAVCRAFDERLPGLRRIAIPNRSHLPRSRNLAVNAARGSFLLFIDDDCLAAPGWVATMSAALGRHPVVAGAVDPSGDGYVEECHNIAQFHAYLPWRPAGPADFIAGANMGFRREVIEELGGFNEAQRIASDTEFVLRCRQHGMPVFFEPRSQVRHRPGRSSLLTVLRYARDHSAVTIGLRRRFRGLLRTPPLLLVPWAVLLAAPLIAALVTARIYRGSLRLLRRPHTLPLVFVLKLASCWGAFLGLRREEVSLKTSCDRRSA